MVTSGLAVATNREAVSDTNKHNHWLRRKVLSRIKPSRPRPSKTGALPKTRSLARSKQENRSEGAKAVPISQQKTNENDGRSRTLEI